MPSHRLRERDREQLRQLALRLVRVPEHDAAVAAAYAAAAPQVRALMERIFPPAEMEVLLRHDAAIHQRYPRLAPPGTSPDPMTPPTAVLVFDFAEGDAVPVAERQRLNRHLYIADAATWELAQAWREARNRREHEIALRLADYHRLIRAARTFEEVVGIWPEAEARREAITGRAPASTGVDDALAARIQADMATRAKPTPP